MWWTSTKSLSMCVATSCVADNLADFQFHELVPEMAREASYDFFLRRAQLTSSTHSSWTTSKKKRSTASKWETVSSSLRTLRPERPSWQSMLSHWLPNT